MSKKLIFILFMPLILSSCTHEDKAFQEQAKLYDNIRTSNNPSSMYRIAETMRKSENYDTAINLYHQVIQLEPNHAEAYIGLSESLRATGRLEAALENLENAPLGHELLDFQKEKGFIYTRMQKPALCIQALTKAYKINSKDLPTLNGLGVCNDLAGQHQAAQEWYQRAIAISPANDKLRSNYGLSLALSGDPQEGIKVLKPVVIGQDATPRDRQNLALAYGLAGDMEMAAKLFAQDLDENDVRTNLAFLQTLAISQAKRRPAPKVIQEVKRDTQDTTTPTTDNAETTPGENLAPIKITATENVSAPTDLSLTIISDNEVSPESSLRSDVY